MKIIIVDDNLAFRKGLRFFLETQFNFEIIAEAADGIEFLGLSNIQNADVILMDLMMPKKDGYEATCEICKIHPDTKVIAITNQLEKEYLNHILQSGFKACLSKESVFDEILPAIECVLKNELYIPINIRN